MSPRDTSFLICFEALKTDKHKKRKPPSVVRTGKGQTSEKQEILLFHEETVSVNGAFNGKTEEGTVPDFVFVFALLRGAERAACGEGEGCRCEEREHQKLFHCFVPYRL